MVFQISGDDAWVPSSRERCPSCPASPAGPKRRSNPHLAGDGVIMPVAEAVEVNIEEKDLRIDVYHRIFMASVNTDSAVRITHIPTGSSWCVRTRNRSTRTRPRP